MSCSIGFFSFMSCLKHNVYGIICSYRSRDFSKKRDVIVILYFLSLRTLSTGKTLYRKEDRHELLIFLLFFLLKKKVKEIYFIKLMK